VKEVGATQIATGPTGTLCSRGRSRFLIIRLETFLQSAPEEIYRVISGIQYFHECDIIAKEAHATNDVFPNIGESTHDEDI
jgi:hypothetical protein